MGVRRWSGWIDDEATLPVVTPAALRLLVAEIGPGTPAHDASPNDVAEAQAPLYEEIMAITGYPPS